MINKLLRKIDFKKIKKIKGFSIVIIPSGAGMETRSKHFSSGKVYGMLAIYTIIVLAAGSFLLDATSLRGLIFPHETRLSATEKEMVDELNKRLIFLTKELESLKTTNQQLKDAIMLGDSTMIDSLSNKVRDERSGTKNPFGGNIMEAVKNLFFPDTQYVEYDEPISFSMPLNGFVSRGFNPSNGHMGIDIVARIGSPVYAAASGYVIFSDYTVRDGYMIILAHSNGYISIYKHCSELIRKVRSVVVEGEIIALSGNSGEITTGPHLHFEIWKDGKPIDPKTVLINY